jgi:GNAT superfamily N-acetyltransferase
MLFFYLAEIVKGLRKKRSPTELKKLFKNIIYSYSEEVILVKDLNYLTSFSLKNGLEIEKIEKKHLQALEPLRKQAGYAGKDPLRTVNEYLDNNCNGLIAKLNGEIIGHIWWGNNKMKSNFTNIMSKFYTKEIKLAPSETYGFDFFITPKYRGGGHAIEMMNHFFSFLRDLGYERTFGCVPADNLPARWTYKVVGYEEIKTVKVRRFFLFIVSRGNRIFFDKEALS